MLPVPCPRTSTPPLQAQAGTLRIDDIGDVCAVGVSPDSRRVVVASKGTIVLVNAQTGKVLHKSKHACHAAWCAIHAANFSPDGVYVVLGSEDKTASVVDTRNGAKKFLAEGLHTGAILDARFSPDGLRVILASADTTASVLDAQTGKLQQTLKLHTSAIHTASFSPDGKWLLLGSADGTASVVRTETWELARRLDYSRRGAILAAAFSPRGDQLVMTFSACCREEYACVVNTETWEIAHELNVEGPVSTLSYNSDGDTPKLLLAAPRGALLVNASTGKTLRTLKRLHKDDVLAACFSPNGKVAVLGSKDNTVSLSTLKVRAPVPRGKL